MQSPLLRVLRSCLSAGLTVLGFAVGILFPAVSGTTMALLLVLMVLGIAMTWGAVEAVVAAIAASLCLDDVFLPPRRIRINAAS